MKFYTIFSLLLASAFALQIARLSARGLEGLASTAGECWCCSDRARPFLADLGRRHPHALRTPRPRSALLPWLARAQPLIAAAVSSSRPIAGMCCSRGSAGRRTSTFSRPDAIAESLGADTARKGADWLRRDDLAGWASCSSAKRLFLGTAHWSCASQSLGYAHGMAVGRRLAAAGSSMTGGCSAGCSRWVCDRPSRQPAYALQQASVRLTGPPDWHRPARARLRGGFVRLSWARRSCGTSFRSAEWR